MASPIADGRMINRGISNSSGFASLSPEAAVLFSMLIPWYNAHGKLNGGPGYIKDEICPKVQYLTYENIPILLKEINDKTNVKWFKKDGRHWIHSLHFNTEHQRLDKKGSDKLPSYSIELEEPKSVTSLELVGNYSGASPNQVPCEIEEEIEVEIEKEAEGESATTPKLETPVDNPKPPASLKKPKEKKPPDQTDARKQELIEKIKSAIESTKERYPNAFEQRAIWTFVEANIGNKHPDAIIHTVKSLMKAPEKVTAISAWLESVVKTENANYNAADSERECNEYKADKNPLAALSNLVTGMLKSIPEVRT